MTTGLAGCGRMGLPMALSMQASGIPVLGFDIRTTGEFADLPMTFQPDHFGKSLKTLFSVVRDEDQTDALLFAGRQQLRVKFLFVEQADFVQCRAYSAAASCLPRPWAISARRYPSSPRSGASGARN